MVQIDKLSTQCLNLTRVGRVPTQGDAMARRNLEILERLLREEEARRRAALAELGLKLDRVCNTCWKRVDVLLCCACCDYISSLQCLDIARSFRVSPTPPLIPARQIHLGKQVVVWDYEDRPVYGECNGAATELNGRTGVITDLVADEDGGYFIIKYVCMVPGINALS